jgi:YHS domain-containing protein
LVKDPICGMDVDEKKTDLKSDYEGKTYYFCSHVCKEKFELKPEEYMS